MLTSVRILLPVLFFLLIGCHTTGQKAASKPSSQMMRQSVEKILGEKYKSIPNISDSLVLCIAKKQNQAEVMQTVHAVVWEKATNKIIFQKRYRGGTVSWFDAEHIKVMHVPGIVREDEGMRSTIVNIRTGQKSTMPTSWH